MKKVSLNIAVVLLLLAGTGIAQITSTVTIDFSNPAVMSMEIDRTSISVQLNNNYTAGIAALSSPVLITIKSNMPWTLTAVSNTDFLGTDNTSNTIPCSQLEFRSRLSGSTENVLDQQEDFLGFVKSQNMVLARGGATPNEGMRILVEYRLKVNLKDPAGNYSLPIIFTLNPSQ